MASAVNSVPTRVTVEPAVGPTSGDAESSVGAGT